VPKLTYSPEGADPRTWEVPLERLLSSEAMAIERVTKMSYGEWKQAVWKNSMTAVHALLWVLMKRESPTLKPEQLEFCEADIELDALPSEVDNFLAAARMVPADQRPEDFDKAIAQLEAVRAEQGGSDEENSEGEADDPKAS